MSFRSCPWVRSEVLATLTLVGEYMSQVLARFGAYYQIRLRGA